MKFKSLRGILGIALSVIYAVFIIARMGEMKQAGFHFDSFYLYCSALAMMSCLALQGFALKIQLRTSCQGQSLRQYIYVQSGYWLSRYLQAGMLGGKVFFGKHHGFDKEQMLLSSIQEVSVDSVSALVLLLLSLFVFVRGMVYSYAAMALISALLIVLILNRRKIYSWSIWKISGMKHLSADDPNDPLRCPECGAGYVLTMILVRLLRSVSILCALKSFHVIGVEPHLLLIYIISAESVITLVSNFLVNPPGGLGLREAFLFICLKGPGNAGQILFIVIFAGIWQVMMDLMLTFYFIIRKILSGK